MSRLTMAVMVALAVVFGSLGVHIYRSYQTEETRIELVALQDNHSGSPYPDSNGVIFATPDGKAVAVHRSDMHVLDKDSLNKLWSNLREGDTVILEHYVEYWEVFGKKIIKKHVDNLTLKTEQN